MRLHDAAWLVVLALGVAGCGASTGVPTASPAAVDPAVLVGGWSGQWRSSDSAGTATLEIFEVNDGIVSGRLALERYADDVDQAGQLVRGTVRAESHGLRLSLTGSSPPLDLDVRGTRMRGSSATAGVPSRTIAVTLQKIR